MFSWIRLNDELNSDPVLHQHDNRIVMDAALIRPSDLPVLITQAQISAANRSHDH
jgi:hypothetical protein